MELDDDKDNNDEENYELLSCEELEAKMHSFHSLCITNVSINYIVFMYDTIKSLSSIKCNATFKISKYY